MIDVIRTEKYLFKIDGPQTIGFSVTYWFNPGSGIYITSRLLNDKFKPMMLFDYPKRQSQSGTRRDLRTARRDQTPLVTSTLVQQLRDLDRNSSARAGDTNGPPAQWYLRAVLAKMIPSRRWRSG